MTIEIVLISVGGGYWVGTAKLGNKVVDLEFVAPMHSDPKVNAANVKAVAQEELWGNDKVDSKYNLVWNIS